jgi:hypothetical protein
MITPSGSQGFDFTQAKTRMQQKSYIPISFDERRHFKVMMTDIPKVKTSFQSEISIYTTQIER